MNEWMNEFIYTQFKLQNVNIKERAIEEIVIRQSITCQGHDLFQHNTLSSVFYMGNKSSIGLGLDCGDYYYSK